MTHKIVLIRHGESQWNLENRFTGWTDVDLTANGMAEAKAAGTFVCLKRVPVGPRPAHFVSMKNNEPVLVTPIPYEHLL